MSSAYPGCQIHHINGANLARSLRWAHLMTPDFNDSEQTCVYSSDCTVSSDLHSSTVMQIRLAEWRKGERNEGSRVSESVKYRCGGVDV